ncbi:unnamed protein product [Cylicocyclus nassatus]|uniref:Uncharacterized protein n=1 Tax=Cylicocyclus nassatus TaxID=53992 RepID=A0AA36GY36_CYLNA|nr:unnamed protein product [Cylicocyclus nassatus]
MVPLKEAGRHLYEEMPLRFKENDLLLSASVYNSSIFYLIFFNLLFMGVEFQTPLTFRAPFLNYYIKDILQDSATHND